MEACGSLSTRNEERATAKYEKERNQNETQNTNEIKKNSSRGIQRYIQSATTHTLPQNN